MHNFQKSAAHCPSCTQPFQSLTGILFLILIHSKESLVSPDFNCILWGYSALAVSFDNRWKGRSRH